MRRRTGRRTGGGGRGAETELKTKTPHVTDSAFSNSKPIVEALTEIVKRLQQWYMCLCLRCPDKTPGEKKLYNCKNQVNAIGAHTDSASSCKPQTQWRETTAG